MLPVMPSTRKIFICIYIYHLAREPSVLNPRGVGRRPKKQKVRGRLLSVTTTRGDTMPLSSVVPLGRLGTPEEIAKVVVFLPSDDCSYVTATELFVEGGFAQV
jgi:NAD(P)-dependent dehydrogenase (short-subunit alcohol dehydrogenase family)